MPRNPTTEIAREEGRRGLCLDVLLRLVDDLRERIEHCVLDSSIKHRILLEHLQDDVVHGLLCRFGNCRCRLLKFPHHTIEQRGDDSGGHTRNRGSCRWRDVQFAPLRESGGSCADVGLLQECSQRAGRRPCRFRLTPTNRNSSCSSTARPDSRPIEGTTSYLHAVQSTAVTPRTGTESNNSFAITRWTSCSSHTTRSPMLNLSGTDVVSNSLRLPSHRNADVLVPISF